ncbi:MAG TPA: DUF5678 domain-containing protein [Conexivisphaerales archaeon]|nr:DUF5678 domain-containing protein [Conexivisphaerales archaeon]
MNPTALECLSRMWKELSPYLGEWVAIVDFEIVSHGEDQETVMKAAVAARPGSEPFLMRVPTVTTIPYREPSSPFRRG